jgi:hypothetical protein
MDKVEGSGGKGQGQDSVLMNDNLSFFLLSTSKLKCKKQANSP